MQSQVGKLNLMYRMGSTLALATEPFGAHRQFCKPLQLLTQFGLTTLVALPQQLLPSQLMMKSRHSITLQMNLLSLKALLFRQPYYQQTQVAHLLLTQFHQIYSIYSTSISLAE